MKKTMAVLLVFLLLFSLALVGCDKKSDDATEPEVRKETSTTGQPTSSETTTEEEEEIDIWEKYDPPLVLNVPFIDQNRTAPAGDDPKYENIWTRAYKEELGIEFNYVWEVKSDYDTKLNMAIASADLPDMFSCNIDTYVRLAKAGQIADLTDLYEQYMIPELYDTAINKDPLYMDTFSVDGRIYGLSGTLKPTTVFLHYRNDWAEAADITEKPETLQDVIDMAYAFKDGDPNGDGTPTVGLGMANDIFGTAGSIWLLFNAFGAYPDIWIDGDDGQLTYGGIQEENKEALELLQTLYADGVIDSEFALKGRWAEMQDDIASGKIGMLFTPEYITDMVGVRTLGDNKPWEATWTSVILTDYDGNLVKGKSVGAGSNTVIYVVNKDFDHPEALIKMNNLRSKYLEIPETAQAEYANVVENGETIKTHFLSWCGTGMRPAVDMNMLAAEMISAAIDGEIDKSELPGTYQQIYDLCTDYINETSFEGYSEYHVYYLHDGGTKLLEKQILDEQLYVLDGFYGPNTDTMNENWGNIKSKQTELFTKMIMGDDIDETFQTWVDYFNSQGGDIVTQEVNEWAENNK